MTQSRGGLTGRTVIVATGIGGSGFATLAMLSIASHHDAAVPFAAFATWWVVATLLAFPLGVYESVLARQLIADSREGRSTEETAGAVLGRATLLTLILAVVTLGISPMLTDKIFNGYDGLAELLAIYLVVSLVQSLQRGTATGQDRFDIIGAQLLIDGLLRALAVGIVAVADPGQPAALALAVCAASLLAAVSVHVRFPAWWQRPRLRAETLDTWTALALLAGALGPIMINNAAVPWLSAHDSDALLVGSFAGALTLSRIPLQLGSAVVGPLLNQLSHAVEANDEQATSRLTRRSLALSSIVAAAFVLGFVALGRPIIRIFLGSDHHLPIWTFALLGMSSGAMLIATVVQVRAAAQKHWFRIAGSWLLSVAVFSAALAVPGSTLFQASIAPAIAALSAVGALLVTGRPRRAA